MRTPGSIWVAAMVLLCAALLAAPRQSRGQATERIGTVLVVENVAEVRTREAPEWVQLRFRDAIFLNDTVRTGADSKLKLLLRDDSIMTLGERSEMQLSTFILTQQQRRTVVDLVIGTLRVITTRIFGADSATEVHTLNTVAGIRGTDMFVRFQPPDETDVIVRATETEVTVQNPNFPRQAVTVLPNFRTQVSGNAPPLAPVPIPASELQGLVQEASTSAPQIPAEVQPRREREPLTIPRGATTLPPVLVPPPPPLQPFPVRLAQGEVGERIEEPPVFVPGDSGIPNIQQNLIERAASGDGVTSDFGNPVLDRIIDMPGTTDVTIVIPVPR